MNEYLAQFQSVLQSAEEVVTNKQLSPEFQTAATDLQKSVTPCVDELKKSAARLKNFMQVSFKDIERAEDVWWSKRRVMDASQAEIWEQVGILSGRIIRIRQLQQQSKTEVVAKAKKKWNQIFYALKCSKFQDRGKSTFKGATHLFEKDGLLKETHNKISQYAYELSLELSEALQLIYKEFLEGINKGILQDSINRLHEQSTKQYSSQVKATARALELRFKSPINPLPIGFIKGYQSTMKVPVETLAEKSPLGISLELFEKMNQDVQALSVKIINSVIDDRVNLAIEAIEEALSFYNYFLKLQKRYQQETPEQRAAEKAWISQQRKQLKQVKKAVKAILNPEAAEEIEDNES